MRRASSAKPMRTATLWWKFASRAPIPPKYRAYIGRRKSAACSTSSCTITGTVAATSKSAAACRAVGRAKPSVSASR